MGLLTDTQIRSTITSLNPGAWKTLVDGVGRGTGRLALYCRDRGNGVEAGWYAVQWVHGKRRLARIGAYPSLSLREARERFRDGYGPWIEKGMDIRSMRADVRRGPQDGTVESLFLSYIEHLKENGRVSWESVQRALVTGPRCAAEFFGRDRLAKDVTGHDVAAWLSVTFRRGSRVQAAHLRTAVCAAFQFGLEAECDYRTMASAKKLRWNLKVNPAKDTPRDDEAFKPRERVLSLPELVAFWKWLGTQKSDASKAARLILLIGCRVQEATRLHSNQIDRVAGVLSWARTKSGRPHKIPLAPLAKELIESLPKRGPLFPSLSGRSAVVAVGAMVRKYCKQNEADPFQARDMRRTWRTWAAMSGIDRDTCALIQNHAPAVGLVGWRVYDKADRLDEKLSALEKWECWMNEQVTLSR